MTVISNLLIGFSYAGQKDFQEQEQYYRATTMVVRRSMEAKRRFTDAEIISALETVEAVYMDACAKCIADVCDSRDLETIRSRVKHQGVSFLTITLPNFYKDFERSVEVGYIDSTYFRAFRKHGSLPSFLKGMTTLIFDRETGRIYDNKDNPFASDVPNITDAIRQICLAFQKLEPGRSGTDV